MGKNERFIIDTHPDDKRILFLSGFSGHGFKFVPVMGELIARHGQEMPEPYDFSFFGMNR